MSPSHDRMQAEAISALLSALESVNACHGCLMVAENGEMDSELAAMDRAADLIEMPADRRWWRRDDG